MDELMGNRVFTLPMPKVDGYLVFYPTQTVWIWVWVWMMDTQRQPY